MPGHLGEPGAIGVGKSNAPTGVMPNKQRAALNSLLFRGHGDAYKLS
jgi:hypothetical protein